VANKDACLLACLYRPCYKELCDKQLIMIHDMCCCALIFGPINTVKQLMFLHKMFITN